MTFCWSQLIPRSLRSLALMLLISLMIPGLWSCASTTEGEMPKPVWQQTLKGGAFSYRWAHVSLVFKERMWVIGGNSYDVEMNDVWSSVDGKTWDRITDSADFSPRFWHSGVVFNNKMWVIGGALKAGGHFANDVWNSDDGKKWNQVTDSAPFEPRCTHASLVFQNKIWVIGGWANATFPKHDVWSSGDGKTWELVTASAAFTERIQLNAISWKNAMWVIDGQNISTGGGSYHDVWRSVDGKTWDKQTDSLPWGDMKGLQSITATQDTLYAIGGIGVGFYDYLNAVWSSTDAKTWKIVQPVAEFPGRGGHTALNFKNRLWVIGGLGQKQVLNDVWKTTDSSYLPPQ